MHRALVSSHIFACFYLTLTSFPSAPPAVHSICLFLAAEARGGPEDTSFLFDSFIRTIKEGASRPVPVGVRAPRTPAPKVDKVLVLGSGGLSIGAAGEFDYSGSQVSDVTGNQPC